MNTSKKKFTRILAVVGAALIACCVKLWWDMKSTPSVVYSNIAASSKDLSDTASGASDNTSKTGKDTGADSGADTGAGTADHPTARRKLHIHFRPLPRYRK